MLFMEVATKEAEKVGLHVLFHEKPFAGINGSGERLSGSSARKESGPGTIQGQKRYQQCPN